MWLRSLTNKKASDFQVMCFYGVIGFFQCRLPKKKKDRPDKCHSLMAVFYLALMS